MPFCISTFCPTKMPFTGRKEIISKTKTPAKHTFQDCHQHHASIRLEKEMQNGPLSPSRHEGTPMVTQVHRRLDDSPCEAVIPRRPCTQHTCKGRMLARIGDSLSAPCPSHSRAPGEGGRWRREVKTPAMPDCVHVQSAQRWHPEK